MLKFFVLILELIIYYAKWTFSLDKEGNSRKHTNSLTLNQSLGGPWSLSVQIRFYPPDI